VTFSSVLRAFCKFFAVFCDVTSQNAFCDCFEVCLRCVCGVLQMFCERCFVQYSQIFLLLENSRNIHERIVLSIVSFLCFSGFFDVFRVFCVFCGNTAKHSQNTAKHPQNSTKHPQNTTKHHKTHLLTKQPEFANNPALARGTLHLKSFKIRCWEPSPQMPYFKQNTGHTHNTREPPHNRTHERNTRPNHLAAIGGCATAVRATSHARLDVL